MTEIIKNEVEITEPKVNWHKVNLTEWETPKQELEKEPEYKHLVALCNELGLEL